jgi:hypothetical protein
MVGSPQSQATTAAGSSQSTGAGGDSDQKPADNGSPGAGKSPDPQQQPGNPGNPGKPGKLPPVNQVPAKPITLPGQGLPKPPFPKPVPPWWGVRHP